LLFSPLIKLKFLKVISILNFFTGLQLESNIPSATHRLTVSFVKVMSFIALLLPLTYFPALVLWPCVPPFTVSWHEACKTHGNIDICVRLSVAVIDLIFYMIILNDWVIHTTFNGFVIFVCLREHLKTLFKKCDQLNVFQSIRIHEGIRYLFKITNNAYKPCLVISIIISLTGLEIICGAGLFHGIRTYNREHNISLICLCLYVYTICGVLVTIVFTVTASVDSNSKECLVKFLNNRTANTKYIRKVMQCKKPISIAFNQCQVTKYAPIKVQDFCVNNIVALIFL